MPRMTKGELANSVCRPMNKITMISGNTIEYLNDEGNRTIRHFRTDIITFLPDGSIRLNSGGYRSKTTKSRLNELQDLVTIYQEQRVWYVRFNPTHWADDSQPTYVFNDGMIVYYDRTVSGAGKRPDPTLIKSIRKYVDGFVKALPVVPPSGGDCWICSMESSDVDHLLSHIEESYFVPRLMLSAMKEAGCGPVVLRCAFELPDRTHYESNLLNSYRQQFKRYLYDYLYSRIVDGRTGSIEKSDGFAL